MLDRRVVTVVRAGFVSVMAVLAILPQSWLEGQGSVCLVRAVFGRDCPGCGMTRAVSAILHGDPGRALELNAASFFVLPLVAALVAWCGTLVQGDCKCKR